MWVRCGHHVIIHCKCSWGRYVRETLARSSWNLPIPPELSHSGIQRFTLCRAVSMMVQVRDVVHATDCHVARPTCTRRQVHGARTKSAGCSSQATGAADVDGHVPSPSDDFSSVICARSTDGRAALSTISDAELAAEVEHGPLRVTPRETARDRARRTPQRPPARATARHSSQSAGAVDSPL